MKTVSYQKRSRIPGHKCMGAKIYIRVECECGWRSPTYGGSFRGEAYQEWRIHRDQCAGKEESKP